MAASFGGFLTVRGRITKKNHVVENQRLTKFGAAYSTISPSKTRHHTFLHTKVVLLLLFLDRLTVGVYLRLNNVRVNKPELVFLPIRLFPFLTTSSVFFLLSFNTRYSH